ncbi:GNAT family N-acetyltransferase [Guptibacillus hwajinpoensis]|uniref:Lysine N-acyltransferase MbtK n=1 Tax=Guptibacillus hwajinpoensis TaxID=208199 RepID=A0ABU0K1N0_9BACL|nr:GNAT family N-acetyltransferase [Alkalihalobacillus hemicentroti]MDQ0483253.1 RimJ/RimL family protein N-acetyltransferase [Alkalihalobacillus hemicentroti]
MGTDTIATISFQRVDFKRDVELLHRWMNEDHVHPFWNLNVSLDVFKNHLKNALADTHQSLYVGMVEGTPMSYWEAYWVKGDVTEDTYESEPYDQGVHLLIGEKEYLGKGLATPLLREMVAKQFKEKRTKRVIAEPDIRNEKMIHVFQKCGFEPAFPITLPDKTGLLMFCERDQFERMWGYA